MPSVVYKTQPVYPQEAKDQKVQGEVTVAVLVGKDGSVESTSVIDGPELLQQAAIDAVSQWRFRPGMKDGEPVQVKATISLNFRLI